MIRLQAGDDSALADIASAWSSTLVGYFHSKLGGRDHQAAEELAQDVLVRIWKCRDQYIPGGKFRAWACTIANRLLVDHIRKARRRKAQTSGGVDAYDPMLEVESEIANPADAAADAEEHEHLGMLVGELTEIQADVCREFYWGGLTLVEIAARRNTPVPTMKSRFRSAHAKLRKWLAEDEDGVADIADDCDSATEHPLPPAPARQTGPRQLTLAFCE